MSKPASRPTAPSLARSCGAPRAACRWRRCPSRRIATNEAHRECEMAELRFSKSHEWLRVDGGVATVGITKYAAEQLGDVVFVELPEKGKKVSAGGEVAVVESVKAASEIYAPLAGEVTESNAAI